VKVGLAVLVVHDRLRAPAVLKVVAAVILVYSGRQLGTLDSSSPLSSSWL